MVFILSSCTKEVPKELLKTEQENKTPITQQQMPDDSIHRNLMNNDMNTSSSNGDDEKLVEELTKEADEADTKYQKTKSEADKKEAIERQMEAANYLMFQADLPPKEKYRPALKRYRRVLELDPNNKEAYANKKQIEDIYESMGRPIP
jgi:tetratricopeptide (TPR) repeat protein